MSLPKERIDVLLVEQGYYESREKAKLQSWLDWYMPIMSRSKRRA